MLNLRITHDRAIGELRRIPHKTFQDGITTHWVVDANGNVQGQSVCWLFCWGKTGRGSEDAASAARQAFDAILDLPFTAFDSRVPHEWARWARYTREDVEPQLIAYLNDLLTESIEIAYSRSQGIQLTPEIRRAIELHAMDEARRHYEARGFDVHDHSRSWPYDLECVSEHRSVFVEVKGTQTLGEQILLTPGEVRFARENRPTMVLFLVSQVTVSTIEGTISVSGGRIRILDPWDVDKGELWPVSYMHALPKNSMERGS